MTKMNERQDSPDVWTRLWGTAGHILRVLLRVLFVIVVGVLLAAAVYFGAPWVYRQLVHPVQSSVAQLGRLQRQMDETNVRWAERFSEQQGRIADLESELAQQRERTAGVESGLSGMEVRVKTVETALADQRAALDKLSSAMAGISADRAREADVAALRKEFSALQVEVALSDEITGQIDTLAHRVLLMQAWQEVLKTQLYLTEGNVRDAEATLELAMTRLDQAAKSSPAGDEEAIDTVMTYLTSAMRRLREQPIVAAQDLESAWYELAALITPPE